MLRSVFEASLTTFWAASSQLVGDSDRISITLTIFAIVVLLFLYRVLRATRLLQIPRSPQGRPFFTGSHWSTRHRLRLPRCLSIRFPALRRIFLFPCPFPSRPTAA